MMKVTAFWIFPSGSFYLEQTHFTICVPLVKPFGPDIINWFLKSSLLMYYNCSCWLFKIHCMVVYIFPQEAKDWIYFVGRLQITGKAVFWFSELMELCWLTSRLSLKSHCHSYVKLWSRGKKLFIDTSIADRSPPNTPSFPSSYNNCLYLF